MKYKVIKILAEILRELSKEQNNVTDTYFNFPKSVRNFYWKRLEAMLNLSLCDINANEKRNVLDLGSGRAYFYLP